MPTKKQLKFNHSNVCLFLVFIRSIEQQLRNLRLLLDVGAKIDDIQFYDSDVNFNHIKYYFWHNDIEIGGVKAATSYR